MDATSVDESDETTADEPERPARPGRMVVGVAAGAVLTGLLVLGWALAGQVDAAGRVQQATQGEIFDFGIAVPEAPLTVGDSITFPNNGGRPHTVTDRGGTFDTGALLPGESGTITFDTPGAFEVFCRINPSSMNARVVVESGPDAPTRVRVQAFDEFREGESQRFDPAELEVRPGTEISVANVGGLPHTLTAEDGSFATGTIEPGPEQGRFAGSSDAVVVTEEGTFAFFCEIHPEAMQGVLTVAGEAVDGADPTDRGPPDDPVADAASSVSIDIADFEFAPPEAAVLPGGEVTWTNGGALAHTATFDEVALDTGTLDPAASGTLAVPDEPGSYSYFCAIHPGDMRAVLVVAPPDAEDDPGGDDEVAAEPDEEAAAPAPADDGRSASAVLAAVLVLVIGAGAVGIAAFGRRATT